MAVITCKRWWHENWFTHTRTLKSLSNRNINDDSTYVYIKTGIGALG